MAWFDNKFWEDFEKQMREFRRRMEVLTRDIAEEPLVREPFTDVREEGNAFVVKLDMPGVAKKDVQLVATENSIEVSAERREEKVEKGKKFYKHERAQRSYYRLIPLPEPIKPNTVEAEYKDGVLTIRAERKEKKKEEKKVKVKVR